MFFAFGSDQANVLGAASFLIVYSRRVTAPQCYFDVIFTWYGKELTESLTALVTL